MRHKKRVEQLERMRQTGQMALLVVMPSPNGDGTFENAERRYTQEELRARNQRFIILDV